MKSTNMNAALNTVENANMSANAKQMTLMKPEYEKLPVKIIERRVTQRDIAKAVGVSRNTVANVIIGFPHDIHYSAETKKKVLDAAKELGYIRHIIADRDEPFRIKVGKQEEHFYYNGNFHSREEEVQHMRYLRAKGYTNAEIAKKIGRNYVTVYKKIGKQPEEYTKMSRRLSGERISSANAARRALANRARIDELSEKLAKLDHEGEQLAREQEVLTAKISANNAERSSVSSALNALRASA